MIKFIDTSHWEGLLDFYRLFENDIFAYYLKATEGYTFIDDTFLPSIPLINNVGGIWGAYHYFRIQYDPIKQAEHFYNLAKNTQLPPVVDVEKINNLGYSKSYFTIQLDICLRKVQELFQRKVTIYTGYYPWTELTTSPGWASNYYLWIANYGVTFPKIPLPWTNYLFWQYTDREVIGKYTIDANYYRGTKEQLYNLANVIPSVTLEQRVANVEADIEFIKEKLGI
jgi:lysozyme